MTRTKYSLLALILLLVFSLSACSSEEEITSPQGTLCVTFIDVGQGDAAILVGPSGRSMLIDSGSGQAYAAVAKAFEAEKINRPDIILISHPHSDHMGSVPGILKNMGTDRFYMNLEDIETRLYAATLREVLNLNLTPEPLLPGQKIDWEDGVDVEVLGPLKLGSSNINNHSAVVKVSFGDHSFLFCGDIEKTAEEDLVAHYGSKLHSTVVKIPHHGSDTSSSPQFIQALAAPYGVLSYGKDNPYGHPHQEIVEAWQIAGTELYASQINGSLSFESDGERLFLTAEKSLDALPLTTAKAAA